MTKILIDEAVVRQALEALEDNFDIWTAKTKAVTALREALAEQPAQQEPVSQRAHEMALRQWDHWTQYALELQERLVKYEGGAPMVLNTSPPAPAQPWVGLTDEENSKLFESLIDETLNHSYQGSQEAAEEAANELRRMYKAAHDITKGNT